jgi:phage replication O-like protein O
MNGDEIQVEDGNYTRIHNAILEAITLADFSKRELLCILFLLRKTYGWQKKQDVISYQQFADGTGIDRRDVITTLAGLVCKKVICKEDGGPTQPAIWGFNKYSERWQLVTKTVTSGQIATSGETPTSASGQNTTRLVPKTPTSASGQNTHPQKKEKETLLKEKERKKARSARDAPPSAAVEAYRELYERYPTKPQMKLIDAKVTDLNLWREVLGAWAGHSYNPGNVQGMLDWYIDPARFRNNGRVSKTELRAFNQHQDYGEHVQQVADGIRAKLQGRQL